MRTVDIDTPDCSVVAVESSNALAVVGIPHAWPVILGGGEEQVALAVVLDHRQWTLMPLDDQRAHPIRGLVVGGRHVSDVLASYSVTAVTGSTDASTPTC